MGIYDIRIYFSFLYTTSGFPAFMAAKRAATKQKSLSLCKTRRNVNSDERPTATRSSATTESYANHAPVEIDRYGLMNVLVLREGDHLALGASTHGAAHVQRGRGHAAALRRVRVRCERVQCPVSGAAKRYIESAQKVHAHRQYKILERRHLIVHHINPRLELQRVLLVKCHAI
jgi:hypothetical protein